MALFLPEDPPADIPEFAVDDLVDATSGQNNVVEPEVDAKQYGWFPFRKRPTRGVMNWLHRHTYRYCKFIRDDFFGAVDTGLYNHESALSELGNYGYERGTLLLELEAVGSSFSSITTPAGGILSGGKINFDMNYVAFGKVVTLSHKQMAGNFSEISGVLAGTNTFLRVNLRSGGTWPGTIGTPTFSQEVPYSVIINGARQIKFLNINRDIPALGTIGALISLDAVGTVGQTLGLGIYPIIFGRA